MTGFASRRPDFLDDFDLHQDAFLERRVVTDGCLSDATGSRSIVHWEGVCCFVVRPS